MFEEYNDLARGKRVLVTGATGYVAGWLVKRLLDAGAIVHAAVRDPLDKAKIAHLAAMADGSDGSIRFFKANLLEEGSFVEAMRGCEVVFHTASPFLSLSKVSDPQKELIEPALKGTTAVLESANQTPSIRRVVLTSSGAATSGGPADMVGRPGGVTTEAHWNTASTPETAPYPYSKTIAERTAWKIAEAQGRWRLVVINPGLVLGPGTAASQTSASFDHILRMGDGTYRDTMPPFRLGMVDVRDVAEAHFAAGFKPDAEGRHLVLETEYSLGQIVDILEAAFGSDWPFPRNRSLPEGHVDHRSDNSKSKVALGMTYRPVKDAAVAMFQQLIDSGQLVRAQPSR